MWVKNKAEPNFVLITDQSALQPRRAACAAASAGECGTGLELVPDCRTHLYPAF